MNYPSSTQPTTKHRFLTRDQCLEIRALRKHGIKLEQSADEVGVSHGKVQYACARVDENPGLGRVVHQPWIRSKLTSSFNTLDHHLSIAG